jgi:DNA polymerase-3 subunit beta
MKFIVSSNALLRSLQAISGVLSSNNTLPILDDFLFDVGENMLKITASDLETTMSVKMDLNLSEEPGTVAIPAKILLDTLKTLPDLPVTFGINMENFAIEMLAGEGKYKLSGHNGQEFPETPVVKEGNSLSINTLTLAEAITKTVFAAGNDELRPVMSGVYLELSEDKVSFVATDAHKLVRYTRLDIKSDVETAIILPTKPLNQLKHILTLNDSDVKIEYNEKNAFFTFDNIHLICKLIEGKYPNYTAVIPTENPNKLQIERAPLLNSLRRVSIFANQSTHQVRFKLSGKELVLSSEDIDYSNEARERLNCNFEGEDMEIGFNSKFLQEMLNNTDAEEVIMEMSQPNRAGLLIPIDEENKNEEILMLVMPVMLNN